MNDSRWDKLMRRYARFFSPGGSPSIEEGWADLLDRALRRIESAMANESTEAVFRIVQTKEKFGTIRIYYEAKSLSAAAQKAIEEAIALAEARSACTCEVCGNEGRLHDCAGWYTTRCPRHADGDPVPVGPGRENVRIVRTFHPGGIRIDSCRRYDRERDAFVDAPLPCDWNED
ncbi:MAG: hypothetical protein AB1490_12005 [Pseudomonadota bacterium]